jgi:rhodanese-related sulfurtransferase
VWPFRQDSVKGQLMAIDPDEAQRLFRQGATLVDVRETGEWSLGHIPGSINLPLSQLSQRLGELDPNGAVLVICHTGSRSLVAVRMLAAKGIKRVYNVRGGTVRWRRSGLPFTA